MSPNKGGNFIIIVAEYFAHEKYDVQRRKWSKVCLRMVIPRGKKTTRLGAEFKKCLGPFCWLCGLERSVPTQPGLSYCRGVGAADVSPAWCQASGPLAGVASWGSVSSSARWALTPLLGRRYHEMPPLCWSLPRRDQEIRPTSQRNPHHHELQ